MTGGCFFFLIRIIHVFNLVIWQTFGASTWGNFQLHSTFLLRILFLWWLSFATPYLSVYLYIYIFMGMGQYLLIPFLVGWTSIYQLFWCSPGVQGFDPLPYISTISYILTNQRGAKQVPLEFSDFPIRCPLKFEIRPTCFFRGAVTSTSAEMILNLKVSKTRGIPKQMV